MKVWTDERGVNLSWKQQPERLRSLYLWRVTNYVVLAWQCALLGAEVFLFRNALGVIPVIAAIVIMLWAVRRNARRIASARRDLRRPDYSRIAAMEREIYGRAFSHDGAPVMITERDEETRAALYGPVPTLADRLTPAEYAARRRRQLCERHSPARVYVEGCVNPIHPGSCDYCHGPLTELWQCGHGSANTTVTMYSGAPVIFGAAGGAGGSSSPADPGETHRFCSQAHQQAWMQREGWGR